ncbi:hypothetical protein OUZ56_025551 [Daphnia magna]|uniref:Uncharacterized protein n=1 Tax=Daphnia magna TaxID=35525 RepID=A0ABQ9ZK73_9CRUS|nr:hypothetical protein OUZ56_025551 [Daphnia magna]
MQIPYGHQQTERSQVLCHSIIYEQCTSKQDAVQEKICKLARSKSSVHWSQPTGILSNKTSCHSVFLSIKCWSTTLENHNLPEVGIFEVPFGCTSKTEEGWVGWIFPANMVGNLEPPNLEVVVLPSTVFVFSQDPTGNSSKRHVVIEIPQENTTSIDIVSELLQSKIALDKGKIQEASNSHLPDRSPKLVTLPVNRGKQNFRVEIGASWSQMINILARVEPS